MSFDIEKAKARCAAVAAAPAKGTRETVERLARESSSSVVSGLADTILLLWADVHSFRTDLPDAIELVEKMAELLRREPELMPGGRHKWRDECSAVLAKARKA